MGKFISPSLKAFLEEKERYDNFDKVLGEFIKYSENDCIECGRHRVQIFSSGAKVCEKCGTDQSTGEGYFNEFGTYHEVWM